MCPFCYEGNKVGACVLTIICQAVGVTVELRGKWLPEPLVTAAVQIAEIQKYRKGASIFVLSVYQSF